jgi:Ice-binding-like
MSGTEKNTSRLVTIALFTALLSAVPFHAAVAATVPSLGSAGSFAVLSAAPGGGGAVTCTTSTVTGAVGSSGSLASVTQTNCTITGAIIAPVSAQVLTDFNHAYDQYAAISCTGSLDPAYTSTTLTLTPGVYCSDAAVTFTDTTLYLDAQGDPNAVWIFKIGTSGTGALTGTNFSVVFTEASGGQPCNVYWWVAQGATMTTSGFQGTILAGAAITITGLAVAPTTTSFNGDALAKSAVTLTNVTVTGCGTFEPPPPIKVTGGGQIPVPDPGSTGRATFGFNAQPDKSGGAKGNFNYVNHVTGLHVNGAVTSIQVIAVNPDGSPKTVQFSGTCGGTCSFSVTVEDHGEPGTFDQFGITVTGGPSEVRSQRVISNGNIQFHK